MSHAMEGSANMPHTEHTEPVPASEFTRNSGRYRMLAQREAVPVSSHGQIGSAPLTSVSAPAAR
jgi:hypothetical protein